MNIYKQTGKAAVLLCLFHLQSSQFKKWLKDRRSFMKRPKILKKRNEINVVILLDNVKPNNFQADSSATYYLCA